MPERTDEVAFHALRPDGTLSEQIAASGQRAAASRATARLAALGAAPAPAGSARRPDEVDALSVNALLAEAIERVMGDDLGGPGASAPPPYVHDGCPVRPPRAPYGPALAQVGELVDRLSEGSTVSFSHVDLVAPQVGQLVEDVERVTGRPARADLVLGPLPAPGPADDIVAALRGEAAGVSATLLIRPVVPPEAGTNLHPAHLRARCAGSASATASLIAAAGDDAIGAPDVQVRLAAPGGVWRVAGGGERWIVAGCEWTGTHLAVLAGLADAQPHDLRALTEAGPAIVGAVADLAGAGVVEVTVPARAPSGLPRPARRSRVGTTGPTPTPHPGAPPVVEARPRSSFGPDLRRPSGALAEAGARARAAAACRASTWLPAGAVERLVTHRPVEVGHLRIPEAALARWTGAGILDRMLTGRRLTGRRLELAIDGPVHHPAPARLFRGSDDLSTVDPAVLLAELRAGSTAIVQAVDDTDDTWSAAIEAVETLLASRSGINAYLSWGTGPGFGPHWDDHDLIVVQVTGSKTWSIFRPTTTHPSRPHTTERISTSSAWSGTLVPGDVLLLPRGFGHEVTSHDELSLHLSIPTRGARADLGLRLALEGAGRAPEWRQDLSRTREPAAVPPPLDAGLDPLAHWRALVPTRARPDLAEVVAARRRGFRHTRVRLSAPAGALVTSDPDVIAAAGHLIHAAPVARDALTLLFDGRWATDDDLAATGGGLDPASVVAPLLAAGLVEVCST